MPAISSNKKRDSGLRTEDSQRQNQWKLKQSFETANF